MQLDPGAIAAVHHRAPPLLVGNVPVDGLQQSGLERFRRTVSCLERRLHGIDRVAAVMTRPVLYELDQFGAIGSSCSRAFRESFTNLAVAGEDLVDVRADRLHDVDIFSLGISTEIISLADASLLQHPLDAAAMIANVQPISHLQSVAANRNRLFIERVDDSERNAPLGEGVRTVGM